MLAAHRYQVDPMEPIPWPINDIFYELFGSTLSHLLSKFPIHVPIYPFQSEEHV